MYLTEGNYTVIFFCSDIVFKKIELGIYFLTMQSDFNAKSPKVIYSKDIATCLMP